MAWASCGSPWQAGQNLGTILGSEWLRSKSTLLQALYPSYPSIPQPYFKHSGPLSKPQDPGLEGCFGLYAGLRECVGFGIAIQVCLVSRTSRGRGM